MRKGNMGRKLVFLLTLLTVVLSAALFVQAADSYDISGYIGQKGAGYIKKFDLEQGYITPGYLSFEGDLYLRMTDKKTKVKGFGNGVVVEAFVSVGMDGKTPKYNAAGVKVGTGLAKAKAAMKKKGFKLKKSTSTSLVYIKGKLVVELGYAKKGKKIVSLRAANLTWYKANYNKV